MDKIENIQNKQESLREKLEEDGIDPAHHTDQDYNSPNRGGCWICKRGNGYGGDGMAFDMEMDTFYHEDCLEKTGCNSILEFEREY